jgi:hypothetical protein
MIYEELNGKDLKSVVKEYLSALASLEILYDNQQSSLFQLVLPDSNEI